LGGAGEKEGTLSIENMQVVAVKCPINQPGKKSVLKEGKPDTGPNGTSRGGV